MIARRGAVGIWSFLLALVACSSSEEAQPSDANGDGGDRGEATPDGGIPSEPGADAGVEADAGEVAPPPPYDFSVKCTGHPCATRIAARGGSHACVVLQDGTVRCWGSNASGQLGTGRNDAGSVAGYDATPRPVLGIANAKDLALTGDGSSGTTCVVSGAGDVACFGSDEWGQLGRNVEGSMGPNPDPAPVEGLQAKSVALTNTFALAIGADDRLWSWGTNDFRQLARTTTGPDAGAATAAARADSVSVSVRSCAGTSNTGFVVSADGDLLSWGGSTTEQLGRAASLGRDPIPARIAVSNVSSVTAGANHACVLGRGSVHCWGQNESGQLGTTRKAAEVLPARVELPEGVYPVAVAAGGDNTCIIAADGELYCWGANGKGQLSASPGVDRATPTRIVGLAEETVGVAVMDESICALLRDGSVSCWGDNLRGQLGRGSRDLEIHAQPGPVVFK